MATVLKEIEQPSGRRMTPDHGSGLHSNRRLHAAMAGGGETPGSSSERVVNLGREFKFHPKTGLLLAKSIPGAIPIDLDARFTVDIVSGRAYINEFPQLMELATVLDSKVFGRDMDLAERMMRKNMEVTREDARKDIQVPSILLFREKNPEGDVYVGFTTERVFIIPTRVAGDVRFLYWSTRAFEEGFRGMKLGRKGVQISRATHLSQTTQREPAWGGHRTMVEPAARSMMESGVYQLGRFSPYEVLYNKDILARQLLNGLFDRVALNGRTVDQRTGVSRNDYYEPNIANKDLDVTHPSLATIHRFFVRNGIKPGKRHSVYGMGPFKVA